MSKDKNLSEEVYAKIGLHFQRLKKFCSVSLILFLCQRGGGGGLEAVMCDHSFGCRMYRVYGETEAARAATAYSNK